jgi:Holliday junction resolvase-like predicted endonuclease
MIARHLADGADAERAARRLLERQGMTLVERNVSCRYGEIDLVMRTATSWYSSK